MLPVSTRHPARRAPPGPGRQFVHRRDRHGALAGGSEKLSEIRALRQSAINRDASPQFGHLRSCLDEANCQHGNPFEDRTNHVPPIGRMIHADEQGRSLAVPTGSGQPRKGGHENDPAAQGRRSFERAQFLRGRIKPDAADPFQRCARIIHAAFNSKCRRFANAMPGNRTPVAAHFPTRPGENHRCRG